MLKEVNIEDIKEGKVIDKISNEWMLITSGNAKKSNSMTASWGSLGYIWNKPVATIYVRHTRYTKKFLDESDFFSLCFFDKKYLGDLKYLGTHSGRYDDKLAKTNLTLVYQDGIPFIKEASIVIICHKEYAQDMTAESFCDQNLYHQNYKNELPHKMYIGEIIHTFVKK